jgi:histidine triad (HIT) family protein
VSPCVFCRIVADEEPATVVRDWDDVIAIVPRPSPVNDGHVLVIPRTHVADFTTDPTVSAAVTFRAAQLGAELGCDLNLITSKGRAATQSVFHLHFHLVPRVLGDGLPLPWTPQQAAERAGGGR